MPTPESHQFDGLIASVIPSQTVEINLGKQPSFDDYGTEIKSALTQFPPEVTAEFKGDYQTPSNRLITDIQSAIASRELAIDNYGKDFDPTLQSDATLNTELNSSKPYDDPWNDTP